MHAKSTKLDNALNSLAWLRATCPEARVRNGKEAVEFATKACELSQWKNGSNIDTLAAAYAEAGDFDQAVKYQREVIQMSRSWTNDSKIKQRLALYEQHKAYREEATSTRKANGAIRVCQIDPRRHSRFCSLVGHSA